MANEAILLDKTFQTPKGEIRVLVDLSRITSDIETYADKLMQARGIPFDIQASLPSDPLVPLASKLMPWIEDANQILEMVSRHYEYHKSKARSDAGIIAFTKINPKFKFDPSPYPDPEPEEDWDTQSLPDPVRNLNHPVERRLKQIMDVISSDISVGMQFYQAAETLYVEVERRSRKVDEDGFQPGRSGGDLSEKVVSGSVVKKAASRGSRLGIVSGRDGDPEPDTGNREDAKHS